MGEEVFDRNFDLSEADSAAAVRFLKYNMECARKREDEETARQMYLDWQAHAIESYERATEYAGDHNSYDEKQAIPLPERKRAREVQKETVDSKIRRVEKVFVRACETEQLTYLQAMRLCDILKGRFETLKKG